MMTVVTITQINLRPVQEFTGDRMKQAQRVNSSVRTGFAQSIEQVRSVAYRTVLASVGLGGLAFDGARRKAVDGWELLDKAEERGEEIEQMVMTGVSDQVHRLETQAGNELRKLRVQLPSVPAVPSIPAVPGSQIISDQLDKPLDWTVRRFTIQRQANGAVHAPLKRDLLVWPFLAAGMGLVLGLLYERTGSVIAPAAAHVAVNWINLLHLARRARQVPPPRLPSAEPQ